jgi:hypothetical protein
VLVDLWIHYAELVLGGQRGHTALVNSSIPVGPFSAFFLVVVINLLLARGARHHRTWAWLRLTPAELLTVYTMMTVSAVLSSSGSLHFLIPSLTAPMQYATTENNWTGVFYRYIPSWFAPRDPDVIRAFYEGGSPIPVRAWMGPVLAWTSFVVVFTYATLCINSIFRRQWVDRERLTFPTVILPVELMNDKVPLFSNRLLWIGAMIPVALGTLNSLALNIPTLPTLNIRVTDLSQNFVTKPWNSIGTFGLSFYPFVIGIGYLLTTDVTFSCWFFYLMTKAEAVFGSASGLKQEGVSSPMNDFPFIGHQGAGAFLAIVVMAFYVSRGVLKDAWRTAFSREKPTDPATGAPLDDSEEAMPYRTAFVLLVLCFLYMVGFCELAGMTPMVAVILLLLAIAFRVAATRARAEAGNAWLFGPDVDTGQLMTTTFGTRPFGGADLTIMAYLRSISSYDLRTTSMPHQLDALKMADMVGASKRRLMGALMLSVAVGCFASFWIALGVWYHYGAAAKTDVWRTFMGRQPFDILQSQLQSPVQSNAPGTLFVGVGFLTTVALSLLRMQYTWWPFHPIGYAIANTATMQQIWLPFMIAWCAKAMTLRYGGLNLYRRFMPFFLGLCLGDFLIGGLWTLIGCFTDLNVYPMNW